MKFIKENTKETFHSIIFLIIIIHIHLRIYLEYTILY